jgi:hypothetical protein
MNAKHHSFDLETNEPREVGAATGQPPAAWELVDVGRYRPRRIKGSCLGRELG